jgi:protein TonB
MIVADRALRPPTHSPDRPGRLPAALALALHLVAALLILAAASVPRGADFLATEVELVPMEAVEALPLVTEGTENRPGASLPAPEAPALASGGEEPTPQVAAAPEAEPERAPVAAAETPPAAAGAEARAEAPPPVPRAKPAPPIAVASAEPPPRPATKPQAAMPPPKADIVGPEAAGGGTFGSPDEAGHRYLSLVRAEIERNRIYPRGARNEALEGTAVFLLVVDRSGRLLVLQLAKSSGAPALDDTGAEMIRRAAPLPPVPPDIPGEALELEVALALSQR